MKQADLPQGETHASGILDFPVHVQAALHPLQTLVVVSHTDEHLPHIPRYHRDAVLVVARFQQRERFRITIERPKRIACRGVHHRHVDEHQRPVGIVGRFAE